MSEKPEQETTLRVDVVVIGAGPGGYAAAFHAADRGMSVALVDEREDPGGVCLNVGCIPSKALLHVASLLEETRRARAHGIDFGEPSLDVGAVRAWKDKVVSRLTGGVRRLCAARGVKFVRGRAVFIDDERLRLEDSAVQLVHFGHAVLATGSSPAIPPALNLRGPRLMDSTGALELEEVPARLLVVGGGYIGLEMATVYAALGSRVVVVEMTDGLLPGADRDLVRPLAAAMKERCEAIFLSTRVAKLEDAGDRLLATLVGPSPDATSPGGDAGAGVPSVERVESFDRALVAVGRRPNSRGLGLENTKVRLDERGFVRVNAARRTDDPRILAIGDVAGEPMLAHKATAEARVAIEAIAGEPTAFDPMAIPAVVFTDPEVAWTGLTEARAKAEGIDVKVARFAWAASGRAITLDRSEGVTKLIADAASGRVLGVGIAGPGAGELIAEATLAIEMGALAEDLARTIHPHPTLSETLMEAAELIGGNAVHSMGPKRRA